MHCYEPVSPMLGAIFLFGDAHKLKFTKNFENHSIVVIIYTIKITSQLEVLCPLSFQVGSTSKLIPRDRTILN